MNQRLWLSVLCLSNTLIRSIACKESNSRDRVWSFSFLSSHQSAHLLLLDHYNEDAWVWDIFHVTHIPHFFFIFFNCKQSGSLSVACFIMQQMELLYLNWGGYMFRINSKLLFGRVLWMMDTSCWGSTSGNTSCSTVGSKYPVVSLS